MSRLPAGDTVIVAKPTNNVYTALAAVALVVVILGLVTVWMAGDAQFGGLFNAAATTSSR